MDTTKTKKSVIDKFTQEIDNLKQQAEEFKNIPGTVGGNLFLSKTLQNRIKSIKILTSSQIEEIPASELSLKKHIVLSAIFRIKAK